MTLQLEDELETQSFQNYKVGQNLADESTALDIYPNPEVNENCRMCFLEQEVN